MLAMLTAMSPFAIDTYLAAMPSMADFFGVGMNKIEITLTVYYLGFALGNFFGGPLSDSFGRKKIALLGVLLYGMSALIITFCVQIEYVWLLRILQSFGGGFASVTAMVFVRDCFEGKQVARMATIISMIMMLAPLFAPVIGSLFLALGGWTLIFMFLAVYALVIFVLYFTIMPESRDAKYITNQLTAFQLIGKYKEFFSHPSAVLMLLTTSFSMAGMFTFITGASFIYLKFFDFEQAQFPLLFAANVILNVLFSLANTYLLRRYEPQQILRVGLYLQLFSGIALAVTVFTAAPSFWAVFLSVVLYIGSLGLIFGNGTAIILNMVPQISGSANAIIGVTRFVMSFIAASIPALFNTGNLIPIGCVVFGSTLLANIFFFYFNKRHFVF